MLKKLLSKLFGSKTKGLFCMETQPDHSRLSILNDLVFAPIKDPSTDDQQQANRMHFSDDGKPLLFIDGRLTENELRAIYGDALNTQQNTVK